MRDRLSVPSPLYWLGAASALPERCIPIERVRLEESERWQRQLAGLPDRFRTRLEAGLGIEAVRVCDGPPSELALSAAKLALDRAGVAPREVGLVVDYSALPGDHAGIWSLANRVQAELAGPQAAALGATGAGCAGLHLALRTARAYLHAEPELGVALLVAADCCRSYGRASLPISVMGDAASAVVVAASRRAPLGAPRVRGLALATFGAHHEIITLRGDPPKIEVDSAAFAQQVLPLHFVMIERVLRRALGEAELAAGALDLVVYPNTTALDRDSVLRALGFDPPRLAGPGPGNIGHAFASDLVINLPDSLLAPGGTPCRAALLAVGSGFTWGACIVDAHPLP